MTSSVCLLFRFFALISTKLFQHSLIKLWKMLHGAMLFCLKPLFNISMMIANVIGLSAADPSYNTLHDSLGYSISNCSNLCIAIVSRVPSVQRGGGDNLDSLQSTLKHPTLLDRILVELTTSCVTGWLRAQSGSIDAMKLLLVYFSSSNTAFSLSGWLSTLPDHGTAKSWYKRQPAIKACASNPLESQDALQKRTTTIRSCARSNSSHRMILENPDMYSGSNQNTIALKRFDAVPLQWGSKVNTKASRSASLFRRMNHKVEHVVAESGSNLLQTALRASLCTEAEFVIVLNPRAINIRPKHIANAVALLSSCSADIRAQQIDVVLGFTKSYSCTLGANQGDACTCEICTQTASCESTSFACSAGIYLLGIRTDCFSVLKTELLASSVEWCSKSAGVRLLGNLSRKLPYLTTVCLRERLDEIMQVSDLLALENTLGILPEQFLCDTLSVIIPMGPGHPDDALDTADDIELIDIDHSRALITTLELVVLNASGKRHIEIIIIDTSPPVVQPKIRSIRLRPMISVQLHHYTPPTATQGGGGGSTASPQIASHHPRRGELLRYAVDHIAKGSMLLFIEPGIQLPPQWDSAVYHTLQRPGVGMGCFAYRLHLDEEHINRKSVHWAVNGWLANWLVNVQTRWSEIPIAGQPYFIHPHYLACLGGYPPTSRALHPIDLAIACQRRSGSIVMTRSPSCAAGVPVDFALRHGAYRTGFYTLAVALARCLGATEAQLNQTLTKGVWIGRHGGRY